MISPVEGICLTNLCLFFSFPALTWCEMQIRKCHFAQNQEKGRNVSKMQHRVYVLSPHTLSRILYWLTARMQCRRIHWTMRICGQIWFRLSFCTPHLGYSFMCPLVEASSDSCPRLRARLISMLQPAVGDKVYSTIDSLGDYSTATVLQTENQTVITSLVGGRDKCKCMKFLSFT